MKRILAEYLRLKQYCRPQAPVISDVATSGDKTINVEFVT